MSEPLTEDAEANRLRKEVHDASCVPFDDHPENEMQRAFTTALTALEARRAATGRAAGLREAGCHDPFCATERQQDAWRSTRGDWYIDCGDLPQSRQEHELCDRCRLLANLGTEGK